MFSTDIYHAKLIQNKYFELYKRLIEADYRDEYMETHHILPRCLGGTDDPSNLKSITSRIHFLAHYLLTKCVEKDTLSWYKVVNAFTCMKMSPGNKPRYFNSRLYESNRKHMSKTMSLLQSGSLNSSFGTMLITNGVENKRIKKDADIADGWTKGYYTSEETKSKLSLASKNIMYITDGTNNKKIKKDDDIPDGWTKGRTFSEETRKKIRLANTGRTHSEETKSKLSLASKNIMYITNGVENKRINKDADIADGWFNGITKVLSEETKEKLRLANIGKTHSEETRKKMRLAKIGKTPSAETKKKMRLAKIGKTPSAETKKKMSLSKKNIMWITDGSVSKQIKKDVAIPDGWFKGRSKVLSEEAKDLTNLTDQAACSGGACEIT